MVHGFERVREREKEKRERKESGVGNSLLSCHCGHTCQGMCVTGRWVELWCKMSPVIINLYLSLFLVYTVASRGGKT